MATYTEHYNLKKPQPSEYYAIADFNGNADVIDDELFKKVDKVAGKGLSTNDFTDAYKEKVDASKSEFIGTMAQWNALTTAEKKAFDTYQITDDNSEALMPNYSTTEQKTGQKWIDGKDIYFKTEVLERTIQINPTSWTTITQGSYMDKLLSVMTVGGDGTVSDGRIRWHLDSGNVQAAAYEILNLVNPTITLYYTKTA